MALRVLTGTVLTGDKTARIHNTEPVPCKFCGGHDTFAHRATCTSNPDRERLLSENHRARIQQLGPGHVSVKHCMVAKPGTNFRRRGDVIAGSRCLYRVVAPPPAQLYYHGGGTRRVLLPMVGSPASELAVCGIGLCYFTLGHFQPITRWRGHLTFICNRPGHNPRVRASSGALRGYVASSAGGVPRVAQASSGTPRWGCPLGCLTARNVII